MSFTLPSHIVQKASDWYEDTTNGKMVHEKWIKWYCRQYYESIDINYLTGEPIKRRKDKLSQPIYVSKIDWDLEDKVIVVKQIYKEKPTNMNELEKTLKQIMEEIEVKLSLKDINGNMIKHADTLTKYVDGNKVYANLFIQSLFGDTKLILQPVFAKDKINPDSYCGYQVEVTAEELLEWEQMVYSKLEGE